MFKQLLGYRYGGVAAATVVATGLAGLAGGQTTVNVDAGQNLTETNLTNGLFNGQVFTLGPDLTIEVNNGGRVSDLGRWFTGTPFSIVDGTINVNDGGGFGSFQGLVSDVTMNVYAGGTARGLGVGNAGTVNVLGGDVTLGRVMAGGATVLMSSGRLGADNSAGLAGGTVTVTGGTLKYRFVVNSGGTLSMSGGKIGESFGTSAGASVTLTGDEFQFNGAVISDFSGGWPQNSVFTGTLADGSVFILGDQAFDGIAPSTLTLVSTPLPPADTTPQVVSSGLVSSGLRSGQKLTLMDGGALGDHFAAVGATLDIQGGIVGENLETAYSTVNISGGHIGDRTEFIGDTISFFDGSLVNITGGLFSDKLHALSGSTVDISGGAFEDGFRIRRGSSVTLYGDDFQLNGVPVSDLSAGLSQGSVFTGTLADGTVFIGSDKGLSSGTGGDVKIESGTTSLVATPLPPADTTPQLVSNGMGPKGLRPGQSLTLSGTGTLGDNFAAVGATLHIEGGTVGDLARIAYSRVEISGGRVEGSMSVYDGGTVNVTDIEHIQRLEAWAGSQVTVAGGDIEVLTAYQGGAIQIDGGVFENVSISYGSSAFVSGGSFGVGTFSRVSVTESEMTITGGSFGRSVSVRDGTLHVFAGVIGEDLTINSDSLVNVHGGIIGDHFGVTRGSTANITGGQIGASFGVGSDSLVNIYGGTFGPGFGAGSGSEVNLYVLELLLGGTPIDLLEGVPLTITERDGVLLRAILSDGSSFDLTLHPSSVSGQDWIDTGATLTVTLVPEPAGLALLMGGCGLVLGRRH